VAERFDPFTVEILKDKLAATADEMGVVLARTSMSPIVYEVLDFACGITDTQGRVVAQTNGLTLFTGTFGPQVQSLIDRHGLDGMRDGDVFATNVPYDGGTHTCDVCLVRPVVFAGRIVAFATGSRPRARRSRGSRTASTAPRTSSTATASRASTCRSSSR